VTKRLAAQRFESKEVTNELRCSVKLKELGKIFTRRRYERNGERIIFRGAVAPLREKNSRSSEFSETS
jgi:hypothetical protein